MMMVSRVSHDERIGKYRDKQYRYDTYIHEKDLANYCRQGLLICF